jgi:hypothetical protein
MRSLLPAMVLGMTLVSTGCRPDRAEPPAGDPVEFAELFLPAGSMTLRPPESEVIGNIYDAAPWGEWIAIADATSHTIKVFDRAGHLVHVLGAPGDGPGEFRTPRALVEVRDGMLAALDSRRRISLFDSAGRYVRSFNVGSAGRGLASLPDGSALLVGGPASLTEDGPGAAALMYDLNGELLSTIGGLPATMHNREPNFLEAFPVADGENIVIALATTNRIQVHRVGAASDTSFPVGSSVYRPPAWPERKEAFDPASVVRWTYQQQWTERLLRLDDGEFMAAFSRYDTLTSRPVARYVVFTPTGSEIAVSTVLNRLFDFSRGDTLFDARLSDDGVATVDLFLLQPGWR